MNYLELVQMLASEAGVTSKASNISTVANQSGEALRLVNWIKNAWIAIQGKHTDWKFMRDSFSFVTIASQSRYTYTEAGIATFSNWLEGSMRCYTTALNYADELPLEVMTYDDWRDDYEMGSMRSVSERPMVASVAPDDSLCLGPVPLAGYTILGDYYRGTQTLAADADEPLLPEKYHMAIVEKARIYYANYEAAEEQKAGAKEAYNEIMRQMINEQLPEVSIGM